VDRRRSILTNAPRWIYVAVYQTRDENVSEMQRTSKSICGFQQRARKICNHFWNTIDTSEKNFFVTFDLTLKLILSVNYYKKRKKILCNVEAMFSRFKPYLWAFQKK